jgi:S1-C subfamily serine protease
MLVRTFKKIPSYILVLCFSTFFFFSVVHYKQKIVAAVEQSHETPRSEEEQRIINIYRQTNEAVVFITTITLTMDPFDFFLAYQPRKGTGSGIVVDSKRGILLTNLHVVGEAHKIEVTLADGNNYSATTIGTDEHTDIAVLKLKKIPSRLSEISFGNSSHVEVGQRVVAIGNPFGLNRTLTTGSISSLSRNVKSPSGTVLRGLIQTDAAINPGNSGGPLIDMSGQLIGINSAILSQSGDSAGIGFASPINQIKRLLPRLISGGKVLRPELGWVLIDTSVGPMVLRTLDNTPASKAGIEPIERKVKEVFLRGFVRDTSRADVVVAIDGKETRTVEEVEEALELHEPPHSPVKLELKRGILNGKLKKMSVVPEVS